MIRGLQLGIPVVTLDWLVDSVRQWKRKEELAYRFPEEETGLFFCLWEWEVSSS